MRLLVIGCGSIGTRHIRNLQLFPNIEVIAHDIDGERAIQVNANLGVWTTSRLDRALDRNPDAVLICVPTYIHLDLAQSALDAGAHVFVEKPLSHSLDGVAEFIERARVLGKIVLVGCNLRFHPPIKQIQTWLDAGNIGRLQCAQLCYGHYLPNWRDTDYRQSYSARTEQGGGIILDAIHELDLAQGWLGKIESIFCLAAQVGDLGIDVEDTAEILLRSSQRGVAQVHIDYLRPERARTYELLGSEGMIQWIARGKNPEHSVLSCYQRVTDSWETREIDSDLNEMYVGEMRHFLQCLAGLEKPVLDVFGGREVLKIALAAKASAEVGQVINLGG